MGIVDELGAHSIADLGCAELTLAVYLRSRESVTEVVAVDFDEELLKRCCHRAKPNIGDRLNPREKPLKYRVLKGDVLIADKRLANLDCIIAIELIEHLHVHQVEGFTKNIFQTLRPKHAIITTPNSDFNILFDLQPGNFRHYDHKFEWSQNEFLKYCDSIKEKYGYDYSLSGVGTPPDQHASFGFCTQIAVFTDKSEVSHLHASLLPEVYSTVYEVDYPVVDTSISIDDRLRNEIMFHAQDIARTDYLENYNDVSFVSVDEVLNRRSVARFSPTVEKVVELGRELPGTQFEGVHGDEKNGYFIHVKNEDSYCSVSDNESDY